MLILIHRKGFLTRKKLANEAEARKSRGELPVILDILCPEGATAEGEGCGNDTNGGCWSNPPVFGSIDCGETICGSAYKDEKILNGISGSIYKNTCPILKKEANIT